LLLERFEKLPDFGKVQGNGHGRTSYFLIEDCSVFRRFKDI